MVAPGDPWVDEVGKGSANPRDSLAQNCGNSCVAQFETRAMDNSAVMLWRGCGGLAGPQFAGIAPRQARGAPRADGSRAGKPHTPMKFAFFHMTAIAVLAVLVMLILGLLNLARGKSASTSQKLMRWRVGLQFLAIIVIMVAVYLMRG